MKFFKKGEYTFPRIIGKEFFLDNGMFEEKNSNGFYPMRLVYREGDELKVALSPERIEGVKLEQGQYFIKVEEMHAEKDGSYSLRVKSVGQGENKLEFMLEGSVKK